MNSKYILLKYLDKPMKLTENIRVKQIHISELIENGEEWFNTMLKPFKQTTEFFKFDIVSEEESENTNEIYNTILKLEHDLYEDNYGDIVKNKEDLIKIEEMKKMFIVSRNCSVTQQELNDMTLLDCYFRVHEANKQLSNEPTALDQCIDSLKYFLDVEIIDIDMKNKQLIVHTDSSIEIIDDDIFERIEEMILTTNYETKSQVVKPPKFADEKTRLEYEELMRARKAIEDLKAETTNQSVLDYILGYVIHSDGGDYSKVLNYTVAMLFDRYHVLQAKESYSHNMSMLGREGVDISKLDLKHWIEKRKDNYE